jgi:hypothetical protein
VKAEFLEDGNEITSFDRAVRRHQSAAERE